MKNFLFLVALTLLASAVRIGVISAKPQKWWNNDTRLYFEQADELLRGTWINFFPNGYPAIIALLKMFFMGNENLIILTLLSLNVTLAGCTLVLIYCITLELTRNNSAALVASALYSVWPNQINYCAQLMTEVTATFLLLLAVFFLLRNKGILSAITFGAMIFVRVSLAPLVVLMPLIAQGNKRLSLRFLVIIISLAAGVLLPALVARAFFEEKGSGHLGVNFLIAARTTGGELAVPPGVKAGTVSTIDGLKEYFASLLENPSRFWRQRALALWELWGPWPSQKVWVSPLTGHVYGRSFVESLLIALRFPLFVFGIVALLIYGKKREVLFISLPVIYLTILHTIFYGLPRYTFTSEPFLMILVSYFIQPRPQNDAGKSARISHLFSAEDLTGQIHSQ